MKSRRRHDLVLAIYPSTRGFAFVLFEGALAPVDWGVAEIRGRRKNSGCLARIGSLIDRYAPDVLVLQDMSERGTRRSDRIRKLNESIEALASEKGSLLARYSRKQVRDLFASFGLPTKQGIAEAIAYKIPIFRRLLPPPRKIWMSEDARMTLFDAAALALTFFYTEASRLDSAA